MEEKFNTSFIPKKSLEADVKDTSKDKYAKHGQVHGPGFLVSMLVFVLSIVASLGLFGYLKIVEKSAEEKITKLEEQKNKFNEEQIKVLLRADTRIKSVKNILNNHVAFSELLRHLEKITLKDVQYTNLVYSGNIGETPIVSVTGKTRSYQDVALQTTEYRNSTNMLTPTVKALERNKETKAVEFEVGAILDPRITLFSSALKNHDDTATEENLNNINLSDESTTTEVLIETTSSTSENS